MLDVGDCLDALRREAETARKKGDEEAVHRFRTTAARMDAWLRVASHRALRDDLRWIRRCAADVRDFDVVLREKPPERWVPWLRRRRAENLTRFRSALASPRYRSLGKAFGLLAPLPRPEAEDRLPKLARKVFARAEAAEEVPHDAERLHALRRALRRMRYALEWVGRDAEPLQRAQKAFGEMNDAYVTLRILAAYRHAKRFDDWRERLKGRLASRRDRALGAWVQVRPRLGKLAR